MSVKDHSTIAEDERGVKVGQWDDKRGFCFDYALSIWQSINTALQTASLCGRTFFKASQLFKWPQNERSLWKLYQKKDKDFGNNACLGVIYCCHGDKVVG